MNLLVSLIKVWTALKIVTFSSGVRFSFPNKSLLTFSGLKFLVDRNSAKIPPNRSKAFIRARALIRRASDLLIYVLNHPVNQTLVS